jgi:Tfp pilus assembly protein PilW
VTRRAGFTVVEILISLVIFSGVIMALVGLTFQVTRRSTRSTDQTLIMGTTIADADLAATVPFDSLPGIAGCRSTSTGTITIIRCTTVTALSSGVDSILIVGRTSLPGTQPDTVALVRSRLRRSIPLR